MIVACAWLLAAQLIGALGIPTLSCPNNTVNVTAPLLLSATAFSTRLGVNSSTPSATLTWGGGFQFRSISFTSFNVTSANVADCVFSQISPAQLRIGIVNASCSGLLRFFNVTHHTSSLVSVVAFGTVPAALAPAPVVDFPGGHGDNFITLVTATLDIPPGQWTIASYSDDGRIMSLPGVTFLHRNSTAPAPYNTSDTVAHLGSIAIDTVVSYATFTAAAPIQSELRVVHFNWYGGNALAVAIASGHKTQFVASDFVLLRDNVLGWRVRPNASEPLVRPTEWGCSAAAPTVHTATLYAANSATDPRSSSCTVSWRVVNATLHCPTDTVFVRATSASGVALTAADLLGAENNECAHADMIADPAVLTCASLGGTTPTAVTVTSLQQRCVISVVLDDSRGFCVTHDAGTASEPLPTVTTGRPSITAITTTSATNSSLDTRGNERTLPYGPGFDVIGANGTAVDAMSSDADAFVLTWWMWWILVCSIVFCILLVILVCCVVRRRRRERARAYAHEFKSARDSTAIGSTVYSTTPVSNFRTPTGEYASATAAIQSQYAVVSPAPSSSSSTNYAGMPETTNYAGMPENNINV